MEHTTRRIKEILANLDAFHTSPDDIPNTASLQSLGLDSLGIIELLVALEDGFAIHISDDDLIAQEAWMGSVNSLAEFVMAKTQTSYS